MSIFWPCNFQNTSNCKDDVKSLFIYIVIDYLEDIEVWKDQVDGKSQEKRIR